MVDSWLVSQSVGSGQITVMPQSYNSVLIRTEAATNSGGCALSSDEASVDEKSGAYFPISRTTRGI